MKKAIKWFLVFTAVMVVLGIIAAIFETDEQAAAREAENKQAEVAAAQVKAEKEQVETDKQTLKADKTTVNDPLNDPATVNNPDPSIGGKSRMDVLVECQVAIKQQLSNPRSFDTDARKVRHKKYEDGGEHLVGFIFYAKNQYNAESEHRAVCAFDSNGKRLTAEYK